jgi:hypothetical protein
VSFSQPDHLERLPGGFFCNSTDRPLSRLRVRGRKSHSGQIWPALPQMADIDFSCEDFSVGPAAEVARVCVSGVHAKLWAADRCSRYLSATESSAETSKQGRREMSTTVARVENGGFNAARFARPRKGWRDARRAHSSATPARRLIVPSPDFAVAIARSAPQIFGSTSSASGSRTARAWSGRRCSASQSATLKRLEAL